MLILLAAVFFRLWDGTTLPSGLNNDEITDLRIAAAVRQGRIEVFYDLGQEGREGLYHMILAANTSIFGSGTVSYLMLSLSAGMLTLALVYAVAIRLFDPLAALAAMSVLAFNMAAVISSRTLGREVFVSLLVIAVLLALIMVLPVYQQRFRREGNTPAVAALGALLGFGFYIHPAGLLVALFSMVFVAFVIFSRNPMSAVRRNYTSFAILLMIILATPYVISSIRLPDLAGANRILGHVDSYLRALGDSLAGFAFVGDMNPAHNLPGRPLIDLVTGMLALVGIITAVRYWRKPRFALLLIALAMLSPIALLATGSPNFLAFAPLLPLLALFFGVGVKTLMNSLQHGARRIAFVGLLALLLFNVQWLTRDLFIQWPQLPAVEQVYNSRLGKLAHYLDLTADERPSVVCARNLSQRFPRAELTGAQLIVLMLNRQDAPIRYVDCNYGMVFINGGSFEQIILPEADTLDTMHPYILNWLRLGEVITDPDLPENGLIWLAVPSELADTIGRFTTTAPVSYAPETGIREAVAPPVAFGGNLAFLGYEQDETVAYQPSGMVTAITYWRVDGNLPADLILFAHILADPGASPVAQRDTISVTSPQLQNRDIFVQVTQVMLPASIPTGAYTLSMGAYQNTSDQRLAVLKDNLPQGNRLFLYPIKVSS